MNVAFMINFLVENFKVITLWEMADVNKKSPVQKKVS